MTFKLDTRLEKDCYEIGSMKLCKVLLMNDSQYPWFILVPEREGVRELFQLNRDDQISFLIESNLLSKALTVVFQPDKLNIAALGNVVEQLHFHHIVRFKNDPSWPDPVWGKKAAVPYTEDQAQEIMEKIKQALGSNLRKIN